MFKYPKLVFEQGTFVWGISRSAWLAIVVVALGVAFALFTYSRVRRQARGRDRAILIALRLAAFAVVLFCLARPAIILKAAVPQQNFLGVLVDDSRSMQISDQDGKARGEFIKKNFSVEKPDPTIAVRIEAGPGTMVKGKSRRMHSRINRPPGSDNPGIPASVTSAIFSPAARRSINCAVRIASLCS